MMINFGSLVQIGIRDNSLKLYEKERKKKKTFSFFFFLSFDPIEKKKYFFFFLSFSHNLSELSLIPIWTRELKFTIMKIPKTALKYVFLEGVLKNRFHEIKVA